MMCRNVLQKFGLNIYGLVTAQFATVIILHHSAVHTYLEKRATVTVLCFNKVVAVEKK